MPIRPIEHGIFASAAGGVAGFGYICGGATYAPGAVPNATVDKFAFSNDARTTIAALPAATNLCSAFGNAGVAGYTAGGNGSPYQLDDIQKTTFADDTQSTLSAVLPDNVNTQASCSNVAVAGYTAGGESSGGVQAHATIDKLTYSSEAMSTLSASLAVGRRQVSAFANSGTAGYVAGGNQGSSPYRVDTIDKIAFPGDAVSVLSATMSAALRQTTGFANSGTAGYIAGGNGTDLVATVDNLTFSGESRSSLGTGLSASTGSASAMANSGTAGYVALGGNGSVVTTVDKFAFADDSRSTLGTGLSLARSESAGMANEGSLAP